MSLLRLLSVLHSAEANPADGAKYGYDAAGNRKSKQNLGSGVSESYGYDDIYQLTQVTQTVNGADSTSEKYSYDAVGNRLSALGLSPWTFNSSNQLLSTPGSSSLYDNNGNLTSKTQGSVTTEYSWDVENRLTQVTKADGTGVTFKYDPFGRRIQKASAGTAINYVYDGANMVAEYDTAGTVLAKYAQGSGIDEPLAIQRGGTTGFYHADGLGSITSLTATGGTTLNTYAYDSFGNTTASEAIGNPFRYTGREWDQETGLYYYRARYYDPNSGRFLSEDPIGSAVDNKYRYVSNDPTNRIDPSGLLDVYVWKFTGSGPNDNWGHAAMRLDDGTYISWWPGSDRTPRTRTSTMPQRFLLTTNEIVGGKALIVVTRRGSTQTQSFISLDLTRMRFANGGRTSRGTIPGKLVPKTARRLLLTH